MEMKKTVTMEELQMLEVEENEETVDFCGTTCRNTCGSTVVIVISKPKE